METQQLLEQKIQRQGYLLSDCAMGTELFNRGMPPGEAPERMNLTQPDMVAGIHADCLRAGSDLILTNTFGGNARRLELHHLSSQLKQVNQAAAELACEQAQAVPQSVLVAGSVGPTGDLFEPLGPMTHDEAVRIFIHQQEALMEGGADLIWIETLSSLEEARAACSAASQLGCDYSMTFSFDTAGRTMMGVTARQVIEFAMQLAQPPLAIGLNCGTGATDLLLVLLEFEELGAKELPLIAKSNAGVPELIDGEVHYNGSESLMADYALLALGCGAHIIGGCCGTTPQHVAAMHAALQHSGTQEKPTAPQIIEKLGSPTQSVGNRSRPAQAQSRVSAKRRKRR